jgi:hypothetical protein
MIQRTLTLLIWLMLAHAAMGRDTGYALECLSSDTGDVHLLSFLEDDVNKTVRHLQIGDVEYWDQHTWTPDVLTVTSNRQARGDAQPSVVFSVNVNRATLRASLVTGADAEAPTVLQCQRWSPRTRNK